MAKKKEEAKEEVFQYGYDANAAVAADKGNGLTGPFECEIVEFVIDSTPSGAQYVSLKVTIPGRTNDEGLPIKYNLGSDIDGKRIYILSGNAKGNKPLRSKNILDAIFELTDSTPETGMADVDVWDFDNDCWITEQKRQFINVLGKKIGVVIEQGYEYKQMLINGYSKEVITRNPELTFEEDLYYKEALIDPEYLFIQNKDSKYKSVFTFKRWYNLDTGQTLSELKEDKEPTRIAKLITKLKEADSTPMTDKELDIFVVAAMKKKLGSKYDDEKMDNFSSETDKVPF